MFQRQTRRSFPAGNILLLAIVVATILVFILKSLRHKEPAPPAPMEQNQ